MESTTAFISGNHLYTDCTSASGTFNMGLCYGAIIEVADMANGLKAINVCMPKNATVQEVVDTAKKFLTDNPSVRHFSAYTIVIGALSNALPCASPAASLPTPAH